MAIVVSPQAARRILRQMIDEPHRPQSDVLLAHKPMVRASAAPL